jgi:proline-specific peptidase
VLHGGPGAPHDYLLPLQYLSDERPVIIYDPLACGNSDKPSDKSLWIIERFVDELERIIIALGIDRMHLLGQSWGTMLADDYLLAKRPKGVVSLILSGPCLSSSRWASDHRAYLLELPKNLQRIIKESEETECFSSEDYQDAMMAYFKIHVCRLDPWPDCLNRTFAKMGQTEYENMWGPSEFTIRGALAGYDRLDRLKEIKNPVLFTCGRYDEATPVSTAYYSRILPGSEMAVFENASHEHHLEKTEEYLAIVREFLRRSESKMH